MTPSTLRIFSPVARVPRPEPIDLVPIPDLRGRAVVIVDNAKPNAALLFADVGDRLRERYGVSEIVVERKVTAGEAISDVAFERLAADRSALVLTGSGD